jgi:hypothetical protein
MKANRKVRPRKVSVKKALTRTVPMRKTKLARHLGGVVSLQDEMG